MVPLLYIVAAGLAVWGVVILLSGELVAMLDIATSLLGTGAVVAGLAAVASALNRIGRQLARLAVESEESRLPELPPAVPPSGPGLLGAAYSDHPALPEPEPALERPAFAQAEEREGREERWAHAEPHPEPEPEPVYEERVVAEETLSIAVESRPAVEEDQEPEPPASPRVTRSGTLNGVLYRFFEDGSVEAVTALGLRRFRSMEELRQTILSVRSDVEPRPTEVPRVEVPRADLRSVPEPVGAPVADPPAVALQESPVHELEPLPEQPSPAEPTQPSQASASPDDESEGNDDDGSGRPADLIPRKRLRREARRAAAGKGAAAAIGAEPQADATQTESALAFEAPASEGPTDQPPAEELTPERRLELFQKSVWAETLAELRRPTAGRADRPAPADETAAAAPEAPAKP